MKLVDKQHLHPPFDVPSGQAEALLATGTVERYEEPRPRKLPPDTQWSVSREPMYASDGVHVYRAVIVAHCRTCASAARFAGPTAHKTQRFRHCGISEEVPHEIGKQYEAILREPVERAEEKAARRKERHGQLVPVNW